MKLSIREIGQKPSKTRPLYRAWKNCLSMLSIHNEEFEKVEQYFREQYGWIYHYWDLFARFTHR